MLKPHYTINMKPNTIVTELRSIYNAAVESLYDINVTDGLVTSWDLMNAFNSADDFLKSLREGNTMILLGEHMEFIEKSHLSKSPFVIIVMKKDKIWGVFNGEDCSY